MLILKRILILIFLFVNRNLIIAQKDTIWEKEPEITLSAYIDAFYAFDFNKPVTNFRQTFLYNHNRHNEINLNLAVLKLSAVHQKYRVNLALQTGTYSEDNYLLDQKAFKNIHEANIGIFLNKKNNLALDAGVFASHIGLESAISMDNWTLTRSLVAENSPYYLTGAKLTYYPSKKLEIMAILCNGWQRIQKVSGSSIPSFGTQIKYTFSEKALVNWSTFVGSEDPDSSRRYRFYNNFYGQFQLNKKIGIQLGFDLGLQQKVKNSDKYNLWFSPLIISRITFSQKWSSTIRAEYFEDYNQVIQGTINNKALQTYAFSLNLDYQPVSNLSLRIEGRTFQSKNEIFQTKTNFITSNFFVIGSMAVKIKK